MTKPKPDGVENERWEERLSKVFVNELLEKGVYHRLKIFIRTERKAAAEEAIKACLDAFNPTLAETEAKRMGKQRSKLDRASDLTKSAYRSEVIRKGEEFIASLK